jgi:DNA repair protein RecO (recombination protein O)
LRLAKLMRAHSSDALVLRTYRYGEADQIVVFLTDDRGKKRGVAKNATKSRRRFGAGLESLSQGRATYVEYETRELVRLDRIEPRLSPLKAASGLQAEVAAHVLGHAAYFAELLDEWAPDNAANERLFRLGAAVGQALCDGGAAGALARYFEYWLLRLEGVYPALDCCPRCGQSSLANGAVLAMAERAYVCAACAQGGPKLSAAAVAFLSETCRRGPADAGAAATDGRALDELEHVHGRLIAMHLEKELRSARVVRELRPML